MSIIINMPEMDFRAIDLNLLKVLDALIRERSVTKAGHRLGLSQPATSRALSRLRRLLADRLVVRTANGLELTPRAAALAEPVSRLLEAAVAIVAPVAFTPAVASGRITIAAIDHMTLLVMPSLVARLGRLAPGLDLEIPPSQGDNVDLVAQGAADLALGAFDELPTSFYRRALYDEDLVCVVRAGHPVIEQGLTLERFAELSHLLVSITGRGQTSVDIALARYGLKRRVAMRVPHFLAAPMLVAESNMILSLPRRLANRIAPTTPIAVLEIPLEIERFKLMMIWHERRQDDPAHAWLRQLVVDAAQEASARWHLQMP